MFPASVFLASQGEVLERSGHVPPPPRKPRGNPLWTKGQSGNPSGRPKRKPGEIDIAAACRLRSAEALEVICQLMTKADSDNVRLRAALAIIERGYGLPLQMTTTASAQEIAKAIQEQVAAAGILE